MRFRASRLEIGMIVCTVDIIPGLVQIIRNRKN